MSRYFVRKVSVGTGENARRGPFATESEARMILANEVEATYEAEAVLARHDIQLEVDEAVRSGFTEVKDKTGKVAYVFSIEQE